VSRVKGSKILQIRARGGCCEMLVTLDQRHSRLFCRYDCSVEKAELIGPSRQIDHSFAFIFRRDLTAWTSLSMRST